MKKCLSRYILMIVVGFAAQLSVSAYAASQCGNKAWENSNGRTCSSLGLDSNKAVCRSGDTFAMNCDDTKTQIRTCASEQRCDDTADNDDSSSCPKHIKKENKSVRKCNAYEDGYAHGKRDAQADKRDDYERWDDKYNNETEDYFEEGYRYGYRDNE